MPWTEKNAIHLKTQLKVKKMQKTEDKFDD